MAKYLVTKKSNYGNRGDIVELDIKELSKRQAVMLKPYTEPEVKKPVKKAAK